MIIGDLQFEKVTLHFDGAAEENVFAKRQDSISHVLCKKEGRANDKYKMVRTYFEKELRDEPNSPIGYVMMRLKEAGDMRYILALNKYGDLSYSKFRIEKGFPRKFRGLYAYALDDKIKYIGRCRDNFITRVNSGYGNISPYNCYKDGQATNCHINHMVTISYELGNISLYVHISDNEKFIIHEENRLISLLKDNFWNIRI